jgi:hypothetical protein
MQNSHFHSENRLFLSPPTIQELKIISQRKWNYMSLKMWRVRQSIKKPYLTSNNLQPELLERESQGVAQKILIEEE